MTLDMLNVMLAVSEEGMIEEMLLALLASPQLAVSLKISPPEKHHRGGYSALAGSRSRPLKEVNIPPDLDAEVQTYQQAQLLSTSQFIVQLPQILGKLHQLSLLLPLRRRSWWMTMPPLPRRCIRCFYSAGA
jgi:uncharacterized protein with von Willebrand factor type A (vWA) domain